MSKKWSCPIPYISLSFDTGARQRLCCHDLSDYSVNVNLKEKTQNITKLPLNLSVIEQFNNGNVPTNCQLCHSLEKQGCNSPRQEYLEKFENIDLSKGKIYYLDLTLSNECNLKCRSCRPKYSQLIEKEYKKIEIPFESIMPSGNNQDVFQFYTQLINRIEDNGFLTITGGEPFIVPSFRKIIDQISNKKITLRIFTNMTLLPDWFLEKLPKLHKVEFIVSIDGDESINKLVRYPSNFFKIDENLEALTKLKIKNYSLRFHTVLQAYNLKNLVDLIIYLSKFKDSFPFIPEVTLLEHPKMLSPKIFSENFLSQVTSDLIFNLEEMKSQLKAEITFHDSNIKSLNNLITLLSQIESNFDRELKSMFLIFTKKIDKERNQNTFEILPWLKEALNE